MKFFLIILSCSFIIMSCESEKIIEVEKEYNWKQDEGFLYFNAVNLNSYSDSNRLFINGPLHFTSLFVDSTGINYEKYYNIGESDASIKLPICSEYSIGYDNYDESLIFFSTLNQSASDTKAKIEMKLLDSTFIKFDFVKFGYSECIAINNQNQSLVPYGAIENSDYKLKLVLIDVDSESSNFLHRITIRNTKILEIKEFGQEIVGSICSIGEYFFVTSYSKVFRIDKFGNILVVSNSRLYHIFESSGKIYGFNNDEIYYSSDNGVTWFEGGNVLYFMDNMNYTNIDDRIIGYRYGQLFELTINETEFTVNELDNDGLDGVFVTSVSKFDDKIFVTTLSGVFYKSHEDFFNQKTETE